MHRAAELAFLILIGWRADAAGCEALADLAMQEAQVTSAATSGQERTASCRVKIVARPVTDSEIQIEVWLPPKESWNGRLLGTGNGGYSGAMSYPAMEAALKSGYAVAGSDTGHAGGDLKFGVGHPEKIVDWAYRAVHVMTDVAKLAARNYYGLFPEKAYFSGCSTGGQQALSEAQRYPSDYDGIIAGDPGNDRIRLNVGFLWSWAATHHGSEEILSSDKLRLVTRALKESCDAKDGLRDGLIDDPRRCGFDPGTLLCKGGSGGACLSADEVAAIRKVYGGARNPRTGKQIFPGWIPGSEAGWTAYFVGHSEPARTDFWRYWIFGDPKWDPATFDYDRDLEWAESKLPYVAATDSNLEPFRKRQGKLILYQGWADPVVPPEGTIGYYGAVTRAVGGAAAVSGFARLFMVPGMGHCPGGDGPSVFDPLPVLDSWVSHGVAPARMVASHVTAGKVDRTRPLCPYPQVARRTGSGDIDDAESFSCVTVPAIRRE
jgi:feruloyl esterase